MPDTNDLPTDSAVSQLTSDLCRELYDRFAMGGWMPQDAHAQTEAMIRQRFDTPAADAGPRQEAVKRLAKFIARKESLNCKTLDESVHHQSKWERIVPEAEEMLDAAYPITPPVPQEAAPDITVTRTACHPWATAPDGAMRRVREYRNTFGAGANPRWTDEMVAALIRQAGSEWERELATVIVNLIAAAHPAIQSGRNGWVQSTPNVKKLEIACAEASRLLGGELCREK